MSSRNVAPTAFLPVGSKARELDARFLLAAFLAERGHSVLIGAASAVDEVALRSTDGVYLSHLLVPAAADRLRALRAAGHTILAWDEEGLVYPDPDWYFSNRISPVSANLADALIAWGRQPADDLIAAVPELERAALPLGNPRMDLLRPPFRAIYDAPAARIRQRFGPYVLINTNFDLVNHGDGPDALLDRMRQSGRMAGPSDEQRFREWAVFRRAVLDHFVAGIPQLRERLPDRHIVIRPHPSEDHRIWQSLAQSLEGVTVTPPAGTVIPWIVGSDAVVHNSCTTAVEAFLLGTPVVSCSPPGGDTSMESPLPNLLSRAASSWEEAAEAISALTGQNDGAWRTPEQNELADRFVASRVGQPACERILEALDACRDDRPSAATPASTSEPEPPNFAQRILRSARRRLRERGQSPSRDAERRFSGLADEEVADPLGVIGEVMGAELSWRRHGPEAVVVELAAPSGTHPTKSVPGT